MPGKSIQSEYYKILNQQIKYMSEGIRSKNLWATLVTITDVTTGTIIHSVHIMPLNNSSGYTGKYLEVIEIPSVEGVMITPFSNPSEENVKCDSIEQFKAVLASVFRHRRTAILLSQLETLTKE